MIENCGKLRELRKTVKTVRIAKTVVVLWPIGSPRPMLILPVPVSVRPKKNPEPEKAPD